MKLDVQKVLQGAEAIYLQLTRCQVGPVSLSSGPTTVLVRLLLRGAAGWILISVLLSRISL